jgi:hypothetical protein
MKRQRGIVNKDEILSFLSDFKKRCGDRYGIISLGVFGSVARGEMHNDSDVDICIRTRTPDPFMIVHIKEDIESSLHCRVDIVRVRDKMNSFLKKRIDEEGIYV